VFFFFSFLVYFLFFCCFLFVLFFVCSFVHSFVRLPFVFVLRLVATLSELYILDCPLVWFTLMFSWTVDDSGRFVNMLKPYTPVLEIYRILNTNVYNYPNQCKLNAIDKRGNANYHLINIKTNKSKAKIKILKNWKKTIKKFLVNIYWIIFNMNYRPINYLHSFMS
jgi:hypothetical protein